VTWPIFIDDGNIPASNDAFAIFAIIRDISGKQDFNNDVGIMSSGDDLFDIFLITFDTSSAVTAPRLSSTMSDRVGLMTSRDGSLKLDIVILIVS
jgi:hypothetical protein